jgi:hypothetical protein
MTQKSLLLTLTSVFLLSVAATAQDKLYKVSGEMIEVKVKEVTSREIIFKKKDNPDGPSYSIGKREVERIEYQNGSEDVFNRAATRKYTSDGKVEKVKYGKNIFAVAPLQITDNIGVGLSYERVLDKKGMISFYLPVCVGFNDNNNSSTFSSNPSPYYNTGNQEYQSYYILPGVKIYPTSSKGKVRYSVGPSLAFIFTKQMANNTYIAYYDPYGNPVYGGTGYSLQDRFMLGVMINNTLNIQPTPHLYMGVELGLGVTYMNKVGSVNVGETTIGQFAFKMGYRF